MPVSNNSNHLLKHRESGHFSLFAIMILCCSLVFVSSKAQCRSTPEKVRAIILWSPPELSKSGQGANELEVHISDKDGPLHPILQISNNKKAVFTCEPDGLVFASMYQLEDGNLATLWHTGCGGDADTHFIVFTYLHGKVHQVLDAVSGRGMSPEFVYQRDGHLIGSPEPNGPWFQQRIIIAWDKVNGKYQVRRGIQWKRRLENL